MSPSRKKKNGRVFSPKMLLFFEKNVKWKIFGTTCPIKKVIFIFVAIRPFPFKGLGPQKLLQSEMLSLLTHFLGRRASGFSVRDLGNWFCKKRGCPCVLYADGYPLFYRVIASVLSYPIHRIPHKMCEIDIVGGGAVYVRSQVHLKLGSLYKV